jgi:hypothetical protein
LNPSKTHAAKGFAMNEVAALFGIKNPDGSLELAYISEKASPSEIMPVFTSCLETADEARHHLLAWKSPPDMGNVSNPFIIKWRTTYFEFPSLAQLLAAGKKPIWDVSYLYILVDGEWTFAKIEEGILRPLQYYVPSLKFANRDDWMQAYFPESVPTPPIKRLSKEDWLRANYPELSELPKWRFPGLAA